MSSLLERSMNTEPVVTIGTVFLSIKVAVTAILTFVALQLGWDEVNTVAFIGAGAALTTAIGDILALYLTRQQVTPVANPALPAGTTVTVLDNSGTRTTETSQV